MGPTSEVGRRHVVSGWIVTGPKKQQNSTILKWWAITSYQHSVDNHNNKRHSPISLEAVWGTKYWPNSVYSFLLAVTEVNVNLAAQYFGGMKLLRGTQTSPAETPESPIRDSVVMTRGRLHPFGLN